jgi:hypothetical protein
MPAYRFKYKNELIDLEWDSNLEKWTLGYVLRDIKSQELFIFHESIDDMGLETLYKDNNLTFDRYDIESNFFYVATHLPSKRTLEVTGWYDQARMKVFYKTTEIPENLRASLLNTLSNWHGAIEHVLLVKARGVAMTWLDSIEKNRFQEEQQKALDDLNVDKFIREIFERGIKEGISVKDSCDRFCKNVTRE